MLIKYDILNPVIVDGRLGNDKPIFLVLGKLLPVRKTFLLLETNSTYSPHTHIQR